MVVWILFVWWGVLFFVVVCGFVGWCDVWDDLVEW